jgi:uncharacterized protein (TIGR02145 family)
LPGGNGHSDGSFHDAGDGYWWSATEHGAYFARIRNMVYYNDYVSWDIINKTNLFSVRCAQDP